MGMWDLIHQWRSAGKAEHKAQGAQAAKEFSDNVGAAHQTDEIAGLDFRKAIDQHLQWKERLRSVVEGNSSEQLDIRLVASDAQCVMGKWIHGNGGVIPFLFRKRINNPRPCDDGAHLLGGFFSGA